MESDVPESLKHISLSELEEKLKEANKVTKALYRRKPNGNAGIHKFQTTVDFWESTVMKELQLIHRQVKNLNQHYFYYRNRYAEVARRDNPTAIFHSRLYLRCQYKYLNQDPYAFPVMDIEWARSQTKRQAQQSPFTRTEYIRHSHGKEKGYFRRDLLEGLLPRRNPPKWELELTHTFEIALTDARRYLVDVRALRKTILNWSFCPGTFYSDEELPGTSYLKSRRST